jgi:acetyl-CoA carboxylase biotin carboxyl carrier protein
VVEDQVIGIVEAMKIMNEISTDRAGTVLEVVAENGQTVEYGSPLVRILLST